MVITLDPHSIRSQVSAIPSDVAVLSQKPTSHASSAVVFAFESVLEVHVIGPLKLAIGVHTAGDWVRVGSSSECVCVLLYIVHAPASLCAM